MGWSDFVVVGLGALAAALFPRLLVQAVRRRQRHRISEILVAGTALGWQVFQTLAPSAARHVPPVAHGAVLVLYALLVANMLGFSRWLFGRSGTPAF